MSDETPTSRIQFGTRGQRSVRTSETVTILAGIQGPAGRDSDQLTWRGAWDPGTQYSTDDIVGYGGDAWISILDGNIGQTPEIGSPFWQPLTAVAATQTIENGFEDRWDADYNARTWTQVAFSPEVYAGGGIWIPARLTLVLNTPGAPDPDPVTVFAEGVELKIGTEAAAADRIVELPHLAPTGLYLFYYDQTGFLQFALAGSLTVTELLEQYAFVAAVYYIGATETIPDIAWTDGNAVVIGDERHGRTMDSKTHVYLHETRRAAYESGMAPLDVITDTDGDTLSNNQIGMQDGVFWDEDLKQELAGSAKPYACPIIWRDGPAGDWTFSSNGLSSLVYLRHGIVTGRPSWNQSLGGGAWQRTEVNNNNFVLYHLFAFNGKPYDGSLGISSPVYYLVMGQAEYATVGLARDGAEVEIHNLQAGGLDPLLAEFVPVATFIVQGRNVDVFGGRLRSSSAGDFVDWRQSPASGGAGGVAPHGSTHEDGGTDEIDVTGLSGLLADGQTPLAHAASHNAPAGADQLADFTPSTTGPATAGEKGQVPQPPGHDGNELILHARSGWVLPNAPTKDIPILTRSDFLPTGLTDGTYAKLKGQHSIVDTPGSPDTFVNLENDVAAPGTLKQYGTDAAGARGWQDRDAVEVVKTAVFNGYTVSGASSYVPWESATFKTKPSMHDDTIYDSGTATGAQTVSTLKDTSKAWTVNEWAGYSIILDGGTGTGRFREIVSNTADTLTLSQNWVVLPVTGSTTYRIVQGTKLVVPVTGIYEIVVQIGFGSGTQVLGIQLWKNGGFSTAQFFVGSPSTEYEKMFSRYLSLAAGDFLQLKLYQGSGSESIFFNSAGRTYMSLVRVV